EVDDDLLHDAEHLAVVERGVELVRGHVKVREVVVLLLDLDVAVGELLVLLLDLAVPCLQLGQPPLQLPDPARQLAHAVAGGARGARGAGGALEGRHLEAEALVLPHEFLSELLGLEEHLEEFLALLDGIFRLVHGPASAEILSYSRPWSVCTLRWRKAFSSAIPAWLMNTSRASRRPKGRPVSGLSPKRRAIVSRWVSRGTRATVAERKRPILPMRYWLQRPSGRGPTSG